jgi:hypothetical protein
MDRVGQTPGRLAGQPCFMMVCLRLRGLEGQGGGESWWRPLHPAGQSRGLADRPPLGAKLTSPSRWSSPTALSIPPYGGNEETRHILEIPLAKLSFHGAKPYRESGEALRAYRETSL